MRTRILSGLLLFTLFVQGSVLADGGAIHRTPQQPPVKLGTSGGNVNDANQFYCCSGTLGALVTKGSLYYILSNNHVLARSGQALLGEDISQPGLIDNNCQTPQIVADFSEAAPLGSSNVDAAIALVRPNMVDLSGAILDIGTISAIPKTPSVGLRVKKSGRTTGLTTGRIYSVNTDVNVQYQKGCGIGDTFIITYQDQVIVFRSGFSAGGDSGSLIVTNKSASPQPVALLFAGNSLYTVGNPMTDVINKLGIAFVGASSGSSSAVTSTQGLSTSEHEFAKGVKERHKQELFKIPSVLGVGIGEADDNPSEAVIVVYTQTGRPIRGRIFERLDGLRVRVVTTEPFVAYGNTRWGDVGRGAK